MVLPRNFAMHSEEEMMYLDGGKSYQISYAQLVMYTLGVVGSVAFLQYATVSIAGRIGLSISGSISSKVYSFVAKNWKSISAGLGATTQFGKNHGLIFYYTTGKRNIKKGWRTYPVTAITSWDSVAIY